MLKEVIAVSGKPGLFKLISQGKNMFIVETLDDKKKRMPVYAHQKFISLADIAIYTDSEEKPLNQVLELLRAKEEGKVASINHKKCSVDELMNYFAEILPDYDRDNVHPNDVKKLITWYNLLINNGFTSFELEEEATAEEA